MLSNDFVWTAVQDAVASRRKKGHGASFSICCPSCVDRGYTVDKKYRCWIKRDHAVGVHCYNCALKIKHTPGQRLSQNLKRFLANLGVDDMDIKRLAYRAMTISTMLEGNPEAMALAEVEVSMKFDPMSLPAGSKSFEAWAEAGCTDPDFLAVADYLFTRGSDVAASTTFFWTPDKKDDFNRRLIIPFYYQGGIVGYTGRSVDAEISPKYYNKMPKDYVFNNHVMMDRSRQFILVVEGVIDALAIDGISTMGARLSDRQAAWIESFGKQIILVPDRDKAGSDVIDMAQKRGWQIAFPALSEAMSSRNWWDTSCKDSADAVLNYGRLYTLTSILKTATRNEREIAVKKKILY